jgi:hypothetical protein
MDIEVIGTHYRVTAAHIRLTYMGNDHFNGGGLTVKKYTPESSPTKGGTYTSAIPRFQDADVLQTEFFPADMGTHIIATIASDQHHTAFKNWNSAYTGTEPPPTYAERSKHDASLGMNCYSLRVEGATPVKASYIAGAGAQDYDKGDAQTWKWELVQNVEFTVRPGRFESKIAGSAPTKHHALMDNLERMHQRVTNSSLEIQAAGNEMMINRNIRMALGNGQYPNSISPAAPPPTDLMQETIDLVGDVFYGGTNLGYDTPEEADFHMALEPNVTPLKRGPKGSTRRNVDPRQDEKEKARLAKIEVMRQDRVAKMRQTNLEARRARQPIPIDHSDKSAMDGSDDIREEFPDEYSSSTVVAGVAAGAYAAAKAVGAYNRQSDQVLGVRRDNYYRDEASFLNADGGF